MEISSFPVRFLARFLATESIPPPKGDDINITRGLVHLGDWHGGDRHWGEPEHLKPCHNRWFDNLTLKRV